ncbi:helix-turn-helix domain-containing protein [Xenorhabdus ishibashii]|uniref:Transposase n=1 Tax=Xenorhabdus ishibashii TaxID=1034471 RepID=A0A2D0KHG6_9GAMM|nr:helix-turn-helix domain-containing protein [Xenorhabdus ishibashii]PHM62657.1 transposase [Xenorhabdus ishibashii]
MKKNTRQLSPKIQQYNRQFVIRMYQEGVSRQTIAAALGINYNTICIWVRALKKGAMRIWCKVNVVAASWKNAYCPPFRKKNFNNFCVINRPPNATSFCTLGTSGYSSHICIWQMWRINVAERTLTDYLKRWGFTPQKPFIRAPLHHIKLNLLP